MITVAEGLRETARALAGRGVENADVEARELLAWALQTARSTLHTRMRDPLPSDAAPLLSSATARRLAGMPLAYVLGEWDFRDFTLLITPDVLVPRPETEELFELADGEMRRRGFPSLVIDVGTGSGALALSLARHWPATRVAATDISAAALAVARENAQRHGLAGRIEFSQGDLLEPVAGLEPEVIVANLPYVAEGELAMLSREVRHEPRMALAGGVDGMELLRRFVPQAARTLVPGGVVFLEVGQGQAPAVEDLLAAAGFAAVRRRSDFAGIERFVWGVR